MRLRYRKDGPQLICITKQPVPNTTDDRNLGTQLCVPDATKPRGAHEPALANRNRFTFSVCVDYRHTSKDACAEGFSVRDLAVAGSLHRAA